MATKQFNVTKDQWVHKDTQPSTTYEYGGSGTTLPVGMHWDLTDRVYRSLLWAPLDFSGMVDINSARLYLHTSQLTHYDETDGTGTNSFEALRRTADFTENFSSTPSQSTLAAYFGSNTIDDGSPSGSFNVDINGWAYIDITAIVKAWFSGSANYGVRVQAVNETLAAEAGLFRSREYGGYTPYIWIDYDPNTAPNAPTSLSPSGSTVVHTGTSITYTFSRSDPDSNDYITKWEVKLYEDDGVTQIDTWFAETTGTPTTVSTTRSLPSGYKANQHYKWLVRTRDSGLLWGPYSSLQRFKANTKPNVPGNLIVDDTTLTPQFSGSFSDPDPGDSMTAVQIEVRRKSNGVDMWTSGDLAASGTSWNKTYAGTALEYSVNYEWRVRAKDNNGAYSSWSGWKTFDIDIENGPTLSPRTTAAGVAYGGKQNTQTPTLTLTYSEDFNDHEIIVYSDEAGTNQVWSDAPSQYTATQSKSVVCGVALNWGTTYYWKARIRVVSAGIFTEYSNIYPFYINALPSGPELNPPTGSSGGPSALLEAPFNDPDEGAYGDTATEQVLEIRNNATDALIETRTSTANIERYLRFGEKLEEFESTSGWVAGTSTTLSTTAGQTNNALRMALASLANGATSENYLVNPSWGSASREAINAPAAQGLRPYASGTPISIKVRASSLANVGSIRLYFHFATPNTDFAYFTITPSVANSWETKSLVKGTPAGTGGTVDWGNVTRVEIRVTASGGTVTSDVDVDDLQIGSILVAGTTYKWRVAHKDDTGNLGAYSSYATYQAASVSTVTSVAPSGNVTHAVLSVTWDHSQPEGKAQGSYRITITDNDTSDIVYDSGTVLSSNESATVDGSSFLVNGKTYTLTVIAFDVDGN